MADLLDPRASGLRHLRWAREVLGTLRGHLIEMDPAHPARADVEGAEATLRAATDALSAAVKAYRDFLERTRTQVRGRVRAAAAWGRDRQALLDDLDREERAPLRAKVRSEVARLRDAFASIAERLATTREVATSLQPPLADAWHVADEHDDDDDATAPFSC